MENIERVVGEGRSGGYEHRESKNSKEERLRLCSPRWNSGKVGRRPFRSKILMIHYFPLKATWKCDTTTCPEANKKHFFLFFYFYSHISANGFFFIFVSAAFCTNSVKTCILAVSQGCKVKMQQLFSSLLSVVSIKKQQHIPHILIINL